MKYKSVLITENDLLDKKIQVWIICPHVEWL